MDDERTRLLKLLESTHQFPCDYRVSVIALNVDTVWSELRSALEFGLEAPLEDKAYEITPSRGGKYASHRVDVPCRQAEDVLALYERLRRVAGVVSIL